MIETDRRGREIFCQMLSSAVVILQELSGRFETKELIGKSIFIETLLNMPVNFYVYKHLNSF